MTACGKRTLLSNARHLEGCPSHALCSGRVALANVPPEQPDLVLCVEAWLNNRVIFAGRISLPQAGAHPSVDNELALGNDLSVKLQFFADPFDHSGYHDIGISMEMLRLRHHLRHYPRRRLRRRRQHLRP